MAVTVREQAVVFGTDRNLVGVLSESSDTVPGRPAVIVLNAGIIHRVGPSRFGVELMRELARAGYRSLRFDLSGIGDSDLAGPGKLAEIVQRDIRDAVTLAVGDGAAGVVLVGLCSGADSAFYVAAEDERIRGLVLIDPSIERTRGFARRRVLSRLTDRRFWWRVASGRFVANRLRSGRPTRGTPPGYYGLLRCDPDEARRRAAVMTDRGVRFLYVITGGALEFCNSPKQVKEAMPCLDGNLRTEWRGGADHLLTRSGDRRWLNETVLGWLEQWDPGRGGRNR